MGLKEKLRQLGNTFSNEDKTLTLRERLNHLGITPEMESKIRELPFNKLWDYPVQINEECSRIECIDLRTLVGTTRPDATATNWVDYLNSLHKMANFYYAPSSYHQILISPPIGDLPEVVYYNGGYYIHGNGKHRLTIGKCIGATHAKVCITGYGCTN